MGRPPGSQPPSRAVRVGRPGTRYAGRHRRIRPRFRSRHAGGDERRARAGKLRAIVVAGLHESTGVGGCTARGLQRRSFGDARGARSPGAHGRRHPAAPATQGHRRGPARADTGVRAMSLMTRLTYVLPHRLLSSLARRLAYSDHPRLSRWLIDTVTRKFGVDLSEAEQSDPRAYASFNAFFTRGLKAGIRTVDPDPRAVLMPADGRISQCGRIKDGCIFQAKGRSFTAAELLADTQSAEPYGNGIFATVYLSPKDYHRVHMPRTGTLLDTAHVPGRRPSVGPAAVQLVARLFARNGRLVCHFDTSVGPMAVVMVGALLVSGVETIWSGIEIPRYGDAVTSRDYSGADITLERFAEMARFNYGSTVIVLLPDGVASLADGLGAESPVQLGQRLAT